MSALPGSAEGTAVTGLDSSPVDTSPETLAELPPLTERTRLEAREIIARYPQARSALLPMLHLVQSVQGYVTPHGVALCAEELGLTKAEVGAVATFYTMYKREPVGEHLVSVCTNTLCAALGGDAIYRAVGEQLGEPGAPLGHERTSGESKPAAEAATSPTRGSITLEHAECLAACDYAPVVTVDYEFYDQQDVAAARELVAALRRGEKPHPTRGAPLSDFRGVSRQLAGFSQWADADAEAAAIDAPWAAGPTLIGVHLAAERGETAPPMSAAPAASSSGAAPAEAAGIESAQRGAPEPAGRSLADKDPDQGGGTDTPAGAEPGTGEQAPAGRADGKA